MITEALQHCAQIGPVRLAWLRDAGVRTWPDVLASTTRIPDAYRRSLLSESCRCLAALEAGDVAYFVDRFAPQDQWRVLVHFLETVTFFDIETTGLEYDAPITVIVCWHRQRLWTFVENENLDEFLDLLDDVTLLSSFNGSSFDIPRVLDAFHIPCLPCPHIDLRWSCYHRGLRGGLKQIAQRLGIERPEDLHDTNGAIAAYFWNRWTIDGDDDARHQLIRYCAADVLLLVMVAQYLAGERSVEQVLWQHLPAGGVALETAGPASRSPFGAVTRPVSRVAREPGFARYRMTG